MPKAPGVPMARPSATAPTRLSAERLLSQIVGGPLPTYGQKYGGYPTQSQFETAVIGGLQPLSALQQLAATQAAQTQMELEQSAMDRLAARSPEVRATRTRISDVLSRPIGGMTAVEDLAAAQARYAPGRTRLAEIGGELERPALVVSGGEREAMMEEARQLRNLLPAAQPIEASRAAASAQARQDAYARAMERRNAVAFAAPLRDEQGRVIGQPTWTEVAQQQLRPTVERELGAALEAQVVPSQQLAEDLNAINRAELAQRLAIERYGVDPALAAGLFGGAFDVEQRLRESAAQGFIPDQSVETMILLTEGPAALQQYQRERLASAQAKQAEGLRTDEEAAFDLTIEQQTGVPVDVAAGDFSADEARRRLADPEFTKFLTVSREQLMTEPATTLEAKRNSAREKAVQYYEQTGDPVGAQILLNALLSFDFTLTFQPIG